MAAAEDVLYLLAQERCLGLDAQTGEEASSFAAPKDKDGDPQHWGYVAVVGDALYGSVTAAGASRSGHSRQAISGTYYDFVPLVTSRHIFSLDRRSGRQRWTYAARGAIVNTTITIGGGRVYFVESGSSATLEAPEGRVKLTDLAADGARLVALDAATGAAIWDEEVDLTALQHRLYGCYADEKLVLSGSRNQDGNVWCDLYAFDARSARALWRQSMANGKKAGGSHGEQDQRPLIVGDTIYLEPYAWKLATGEKLPGWQLERRGHGCGMTSASASTLYFRAVNPTACSLVSGKKTKITTVSRPGCWINILPAGGLLLIPEASSGCTCPFAMQGSMAFAPAP
jgi:outer membrane protein assembly factor BamB